MSHHLDQANPQLDISDVYCFRGTMGTVFANSAPNVVLFSPSFAPQRSVRSNLSWQGPILDARFSLNVEGVLALNLNQQQSVDINFQPTQQFSLSAEGNRPVFVLPSSIDTLTGAIASRDARVTGNYNRVSELRSDIQSKTAQLTLRLSPILRTPSRLGWSAAYTYQYITQQVPGFQSTAGSPLGTEWARAPGGPHQFNYSLRYNFFNYVTVNWQGQFR